MTGVPFLSLQGALQLNPQVDPLHNEPLVQMWLEIKIKPLLKSITRGFLSCLSTKKFSCSTYQTVYDPLHTSPTVTMLSSLSPVNSSSSRVRELSRHFSDMDPVRQKWIYTFFMYPFLSGPDVAGRAGTSSLGNEKSGCVWVHLKPRVSHSFMKVVWRGLTAVRSGC